MFYLFIDRMQEAVWTGVNCPVPIVSCKSSGLHEATFFSHKSPTADEIILWTTKMWTAHALHFTCTSDLGAADWAASFAKFPSISWLVALH